jgi:hypothetical protein
VKAVGAALAVAGVAVLGISVWMGQPSLFGMSFGHSLVAEVTLVAVGLLLATLPGAQRPRELRRHWLILAAVLCLSATAWFVIAAVLIY